MAGKFPDVERSGWFMLYFQATGLCEALRLAAQTGQKPGKATVELIRRCREDAQRIGNGPAFERLPEVTAESSIADMLVAVEVLRATELAFMSPQEIEQSKGTFALLSSIAAPVGNFVGSAVKSVVG